MAIKAIYTPEDGEPQTWSMDYSTFTVGEMKLVERHIDLPIHLVEARVNRGFRTELLAMLLVLRRRDEPELTMADIDAMLFNRIRFEIDVADTEAAAGKAETLDAEDEGPSTTGA